MAHIPKQLRKNEIVWIYIRVEEYCEDLKSCCLWDPEHKSIEGLWRNISEKY